MKKRTGLRAAWIAFAGLLLWSNPGGAGCVDFKVGPTCVHLAGVRVLGLLTEVEKDAAALGLSQVALSAAARETLHREIPQIRLEEELTRAPQIHISVSQLRHKDNESSLYLQVEVRDVAAREGRLSWTPVWQKGYVIPTSPGNPVLDLGKAIEESLQRLAADWRGANSEPPPSSRR
ncbi:MAG: hypothetical protein HYY21_07635 [Candidatus Tectomicrobia bacterium]|nr:hypothetical protein [Candidatus Tectomicrobia bacterium]